MISNACSAAALSGSTQISDGGTASVSPPAPSATCEEHRSGGARRDAAGVSVQQLAEARGAARDGQIGFGVLQLDRAGAVLPGRDLVEQPLAQDRGVQRAAVEQDGVHARAVPEEIGQMAGDRAVGRIRKAPVAQARLGADRAGRAHRRAGKKPSSTSRSTSSRVSVAVCAPATRLDPRPGNATT